METSIKKALEYLLINRSFIIPSFEIYDGASGLYDLGPPCVAIKNNILKEWRDHFVIQDDMLEISSTNLTPESVLKASGHVEKFDDIVIKDSKTGQIFRADKLLEELMDYLLQDKTLSDDLINEYKIIKAKADAYSLEEIDNLLRVKFNKKLLEYLKDSKIEFEQCKSKNLMFKTSIGSNNAICYLRPETAQGIFVNFPRLLRYNGGKMPFAVAQIGTGFRNEITPKNMLLRTREFCMAEIEHFVDPDQKDHEFDSSVKDKTVNLFPKNEQVTGQEFIKNMRIDDAVYSEIIDNETLAYYIHKTSVFLENIGIDPNKVRFRQHLDTEMAFYASDCWDAEILTSVGWIECVGIADRSCHDLVQHSKATKTDMTASETYDPPLLIKYGKPKFSKKDIFVNFGADLAKSLITDITLKLESLEFAQNFVDALEKDGFFNFEFKGKDHEITSDMISIDIVEKRVQTRKYIPNVIEPSFGINRILYALLEHSFFVPKDQPDRVRMCFKPNMAPYKCAIIPLIKTDNEMVEYAKGITQELRKNKISCKIDQSGAPIGKQYSRYDELGIPYVITIDYDTIDADSTDYDTVTFRDRDTRKQKRYRYEDLITLFSQL